GLLLLAAAVGPGLPGVVAVLSESPAVPTERAPRAGGQEPGRIADGRGACPLAGTTRPHPLLPELTQEAGQYPVGHTGPLKVRTVTRNHTILNHTEWSGILGPQSWDFVRVLPPQAG